MRNLFLFVLAAFLSFQAAAQEPKLEPNPDLKDIVIVFKTHFDNEYTDLAESVVQKYSTSMMKSALSILKESRELPENEQFVWTLPGWPMKTILERSTPEIKKDVQQALKEGRFVVHSLPFTIETEACGLEDLVRGFSFSSDLSKKFGIELPRDAKLTDVPSHSWVVPTLLTNAGINILHIGCNPASASPKVPLLFWWEGPDGSRLMTMYWGKYYGTDLVPPRDWPHKSWLAIIHTNDNQGPPTAQEVKKVLKEVHELAPNARIRIGRISDFYDLLIKENPKLPVVRGDMPDTWVHGYMSMPAEMKTARKMQEDTYSFEALNTQLNIWKDQKKDVSKMVKTATENNLLFDEHTFGLAMSHGQAGYWCYGDEFKTLRSEGIFEPIEKSWKEKGDRVYEAEKVIVPSYNRTLEDLAASVKTNEKRIVVYNPLPWKRSGLVTLQTHSNHIGEAKALKDLTTGTIIPFSNKGNVCRFTAKEVPAMGYKTYIPVGKEVKSTSLLKLNKAEKVLENAWYRIKLDPEKGRIISLVNKKSGKEMVKTDSPYNFGQYMYERFSKEQTDKYAHDYIKAGWNWAYAELGRINLSDDKYKRMQGSKARLSFSQDAIKASAVMHFQEDETNPHDYSLIISLYKDMPYVEMKWAIHGKPAEPWPEAGWVSFPFNVDGAEFRLGRTGGIVDPTKDFVKGSCK